MNARDDVTRVLIAYENSHRSYGQTMVGAIRGLRPRVETMVIQVRELEAEVGRVDPHLVVCHQPSEQYRPRWRGGVGAALGRT